MMRQGVLGVKVSIMLPYEPNPAENRGGCLVPLSDVITVKEPKPDAVLPQAPAVTPVVEDVPVGVADAPEGVFVAAKPEM